MKIILAAALLLFSLLPAQAQQWIQFSSCGTAPRTLKAGAAAVVGVDLNGSLCIAGSISTSVTFPTIGAAVPATGIYNALDVAGTLRGLSGLSTGALFPAAVAIVDASGTQITSFGSAANVGTTGAAVPLSAGYVGINVGGTLTGWTGAVSIAAAQTLATVTTVGTVSAVTAITNALPAGSNIIGNFRIDQTTPGTTNGVVASIAAAQTLATVTTVGTVTTVTNPVTVAQATSSNLKAQVDPLTVATWGIATNAAGTVPTNGVLGLGVYNSTEVGPSTGQSVGIQLDSKGRQRTVIMDGAGNTRAAYVTAASTAAVATDLAQVVALSPNGLNVNGGATPANSAPTVNANQYSNYETIAASQTGQTLGPTGATGDYLSHCVVYPTTTAPGVVTVFDSTSTTTNNVIAFPGGTLSNIAPFSIPVGAYSINGAWKVTTGTNLVVTCYGKFT